LDRSLLVQIAFCAFPASVFVALGMLPYARLAFFGSFFLIFGYHAAMQRPWHCGVLTAALAPMLMLLRVLLFHNSVVAILGVTILVWAILDHRRLFAVLSDPLPTMMLALATLYWWVSFMSTYIYSVNIRVFELALGAMNIVLLGGRRGMLATALSGLAISALAAAIGVAPYAADSERMGMAEVGETSLGHPALLGVPALIILLLTLLDEGRWIMPNVRLPLRLAVVALAAAGLLVTTSRTNWILAIAGLGAAVMVNPRRQLKAVMYAIPILIGSTLFVLSTGQGDVVEKYFWKAFGEDRTLQQRTTGRFNQWMAFPEILADAPILGHGAGSARSFTRHRGRELTMHSAYLHFGVETGLVGLTLYLILVGAVFVRTARMRRITGETAPLVLMICFLIDGLAHNNFSPLLAVCLGVGMLSKNTAGYFVRRPALPPAPVGQAAMRLGADGSI
jgi:hypothetical protein